MPQSCPSLTPSSSPLLSAMQQGSNVIVGQSRSGRESQQQGRTFARRICTPHFSFPILGAMYVPLLRYIKQRVVEKHHLSSWTAFFQPRSPFTSSLTLDLPRYACRICPAPPSLIFRPESLSIPLCVSLLRYYTRYESRSIDAHLHFYRFRLAAEYQAFYSSF